MMMDGLKSAKAKSSGAVNAFRKIIQDLEGANKVLTKVKGESISAIDRHRARHDDAHSTQSVNEAVISNVKKILGE